MHPGDLLPAQHAVVRAVGHVEGDADGHGLAVANVEIAHLFELVGCPVTEVERAGDAQFERVAAGRDAESLVP